MHLSLRGPEYIDADRSRDNFPLGIATSPLAVYYLSTQQSSSSKTKMHVTELSSADGQLKSTYTMNVERIPYIADTDSPFMVWTDKCFKVLNINSFGSNDVESFTIENKSGEDIEKVIVTTASTPGAPLHFLVGYASKSSSWADIYHINPQGSITKAYSLAIVPELSVFSSSFQGGRLYFIRITPSEISLVASTSPDLLEKQMVGYSTDLATSTVAEVAARGTSYAIRFAQVLESGNWVLVLNGMLTWTRHESLSYATAVEWAEVDTPEQLAHELEVEGHKTIWQAYVHRVRRHAKALAGLPQWLQQLPTIIANSSLSNDLSGSSHFGLRKLVILATKKGRLAAIDTGRQGDVVWNVKVTEGWEVKAISIHQGVVYIYTGDGRVAKISVSDGTVLDAGDPSTEISAVTFVPAAGGTPLPIRVNTAGDPDMSCLPPFKDVFIVTRAANKLMCWNPSIPGTPMWTFMPPRGQHIHSVISRPAHDPVASIGKVLGDRSVLYKYLNPNAILVSAIGPQMFGLYLLDGVSGTLLHSTYHTNVNTFSPITTALSENWFTYSFFTQSSQVSPGSSVTGPQLVIAELYESPIPNDRGPLGAAANYSSLIQPRRPHVLTTAYLIPEPVSAMAVSQTRQGISLRALLLTLPHSRALVALPRPLFDPRAPVGRDPTPAEAEEGLETYQPVLAAAGGNDGEGFVLLSHAREVMLGSGAMIRAAPTLLESTGLVVAVGHDVFGTRVAPSGVFDVLGKGFSKTQLLLTVMALAVSVAALAPMVSRAWFPFSWCMLINYKVRKKQVDMAWNS